MKKTMHCMLLIVLLIAPFSTFPSAAYEMKDWLVNLYYFTNGDGWRNNTLWKDWITSLSITNQSAPLPCSAYGISCTTKSLYAIDLRANNVNGTLPPFQNYLPLKYLKLDDNPLKATLHSSIGLLSNLTYLSMSNTGLIGSIPSEIGLLTNMKDFTVFKNHLTGSIPSEIGNVKSLTYLVITKNALNGAIPSEIGLLSHLMYLSMEYNNFNGTIPSEIGLLSSLTRLIIASNLLTGTIPSEIGLLSRLSYVNLANNSLNGTIPAMYSFNSLTHLDLSNNPLMGTLPSSFGLMTKLTVLNLAGTSLSGTLPETVQHGTLAVYLTDTSLTFGSFTVDNQNLNFGGDVATSRFLVSNSSITIKGNFNGTMTLSINGNLTIKQNMNFADGTIYIYGGSSAISVGGNLTLTSVTILLDVNNQTPTPFTLISSSSSTLQNVSVKVKGSPCLLFGVSHLNVTFYEKGCDLSETDYTLYIILLTTLPGTAILVALLCFIHHKLSLKRHMKNLELKPPPEETRHLGQP